MPRSLSMARRVPLPWPMQPMSATSRSERRAGELNRVDYTRRVKAPGGSAVPALPATWLIKGVWKKDPTA